MRKNRLKDWGFVVAGTFLLAVSVSCFILPNDILSGGVAGIAVALSPLLHIGKTAIANALMIILLISGTAVFGREFFINTALSSLLYPVFNLFLGYVTEPVEMEPLLAALYGGLIGGAGIGLVIRTGASTGGMDIPPLIIHKLTGIKVSTLVMIVDGLTVLLGYFVYGLNAALIGLITVFSTSWALGKILTLGGTVSKSVQIISDEWQSISDVILKKLDRGATMFDAVGTYTGQNRKVILCIVHEKEYPSLIEEVRSIDPKAFIITTDATDMHGEGFTYPARI